MTFVLVRKRLEHLEGRELLRVQRPKTLKSSSVPGHNNFKKWIRCLSSNVANRLFVETSQSTNDHKVQTLRLDTNQLALIWYTTVH